MNLFIKLLVFVSIELMVTGCASKNAYVEPNPKLGDTATIGGSFARYALFDWEYFKVFAIDDIFVSYGFFSNTDTTFVLKEGVHKIATICTHHRDATPWCPCHTTTELELNVERGKNYKITGELKGASINFWIIDKGTGQRVSNISKVPYSGQGRGENIMIPIYIPK